MITSLVADTMKFLVILLLFEFGFTMLVMAVNEPYEPENELTNDEETTRMLLEDQLQRSKYMSYNIPQRNLILIYVN